MLSDYGKISGQGTFCKTTSGSTFDQSVFLSYQQVGLRLATHWSDCVVTHCFKLQINADHHLVQCRKKNQEHGCGRLPRGGRSQDEAIKVLRRAELRPAGDRRRDAWLRSHLPGGVQQRCHRLLAPWRRHHHRRQHPSLHHCHRLRAWWLRCPPVWVLCPKNSPHYPVLAAHRQLWGHHMGKKHLWK